jgi:hypothetical protein
LVIDVVAVSVAWLFAQFSMFETVASAPGNVIFCSTFTVATDVQPSEDLVTVSVYNPGSVTTGLCYMEEKPPVPDHKYVTP